MPHDPSISLPRFLAHFTDNLRQGKRFCFILGAGASKSSGIPTGGELVNKWVKELKEIDETDWNNWVQQKNIDQDNLESYYSKLFDKRFELSKKDGFAFLEKTMEGKEPSCGYSVLAQILAQGIHNVVITTNFDSLTEDALFIYTRKKPLVIGHALLADFISSTLTRPLIIKIHHDLFLSPKSDPDEVDCLDDNFSRNLQEIFKYYTPLVIGYGGNDGSLMKFLSSLQQLEEGLFWFYRETSQPSQSIIDLVTKVKGHFVPIPGFDELMIQLGDKLQLQKMDSEIENIAKTRADNYREQYQKIYSYLAENNPETQKALDNMVTRSQKNWWTIELQTRAEPDLEKVKAIYLNGLEEFPESPELHFKYAVFLAGKLSNLDQAIIYYKKAIELKPDFHEAYFNWGTELGNLAKTKSGKEAEHLLNEAIIKLERTIEINPDFYNAYCNLSLFIVQFAKFKSDSEHNQLFNFASQKIQKAIELNPEYFEAYYYWGTILGENAKTKYNPDEKNLMLKQAIEKLYQAFDMGGPCYNLACDHALLNNKAHALHYLETSLQRKEQTISYIKADPDWQNYLDDPDFNNLLAKYA